MIFFDNVAKNGYICISVKDLSCNNLKLTYMRKIYFVILAALSLGVSYAQPQPTNLYRKADRVYLDSQDGHSGAFEWKMIKAGDVKDASEAISKVGYATKNWMPAVVPGTVLIMLVTQIAQMKQLMQ